MATGPCGRIAQTAPEYEDAIRRAFDAFNEGGREDTDYFRQHEIPGPPHFFLHLENAQLVVGPQAHLTGPWRIRLDQICGWHLGA
jgi:hypothetical protein